jgi:type II secretory pathway pseudopilin PulG
MVELLVVIAVLTLLTALIAGAWSRVSKIQKTSLTRNIMQSVTTAIEEFATEDPLRVHYDRGTRRTFGPYPPYQLEDWGGSNQYNKVAWALEPNPPGPGNSLRNRIGRDMLGDSTPTIDQVRIFDNVDRPAQVRSLSIRGLYAYLARFTPSGLSQVPERYLKPVSLPPQVRQNQDPNNEGEFVIEYNGANSDADRMPVLEIRDGWGVPLDYFMYVKVEWRTDASGQQQFVVTDRVPVLRSRGIEPEVYNELERRNVQASNPQDWIFSSALPQPFAAVDWDTGVLTGSADSSADGWARVPAVGMHNTFGYYPDMERDQ